MSVASLKRWGAVASLGKPLWKNVESVEAKDPYTVVISLRQPSASLIFGLSRAAAAIYPKDVIDAAGDGPLKDYTGTGPYRFVEHKADRHLKLARFKEYAARTEPPTGFGGKRIAYFDEILFIPVPDTAVRLAGVESGEYHHAMFVKQDAWDRIKALPQIESRIVKPRGWATGVLNHKAGLMTNKKIRQALQAALEMEAIMAAGFGSKDFYRLDPGLFFPEQPWHSAVSANLYNQRDKDKARRLLKEAGYAKEPVRWVTTKEYEFMYKNALVAKQQMEEVGFAVDLQVVDWATLNSRTQKPELWDVFSTGLVFSADPANHIALRCSWNGLVVPRGEGAAPGRAAARERRQEAQGPRRPHPGHLLRGRRAREARRLLHPGRGAPGAARRLPHRPTTLLLEQLAGQVARARAIATRERAVVRASRSCEIGKTDIRQSRS